MRITHYTRSFYQSNTNNMPYTIKKGKDGKYKIIRKSDNKVVGTSVNLKNAQGSIAHRMDAEKKK